MKSSIELVRLTEIRTAQDVAIALGYLSGVLERAEDPDAPIVFEIANQVARRSSQPPRGVWVGQSIVPFQRLT